jgi:hypothetical protein
MSMKPRIKWSWCKGNRNALKHGGFTLHSRTRDRLKQAMASPPAHPNRDVRPPAVRPLRLVVLGRRCAKRAHVRSVNPPIVVSRRFTALTSTVSQALDDRRLLPLINAQTGSSLQCFRTRVSLTFLACMLPPRRNRKSGYTPASGHPTETFSRSTETFSGGPGGRREAQLGRAARSRAAGGKR